MPKRILFLAICVVLLLGNANAFADEITQTHTQTPTEKEYVASLYECANADPCTTTVKITIINSTTFKWSDYEFQAIELEGTTPML